MPIARYSFPPKFDVQATAENPTARATAAATQPRNQTGPPPAATRLAQGWHYKDINKEGWRWPTFG